jgi:hypothetical protein
MVSAHAATFLLPSAALAASPPGLPFGLIVL